MRRSKSGHRFSLGRVQAGIQAMASVVTFLFGIIGTFVTLLIPLFNPNVQSDISSVAISIMFAVFLIWSVYREYKISRKEKYANISTNLEIIASQSKELSFKLLSATYNSDRISPELLKNATQDMTHILDNVSTIFSILTGTRCRATLKVVNIDGDLVWAHALARDQLSVRHCANSDKDRNDRKFDVIQKNIDFKLLYDKKTDDDGYYFNNDLQNGEYFSTSLEYYKQNAASHLWKPGDEENWPLRYRSAIVWPIRQEVDSAVTPHLFYGFLAVDSESRGVFEERWDTAVGGVVAHQLFLPLHLYHTLERSLPGE